MYTRQKTARRKGGLRRAGDSRIPAPQNEGRPVCHAPVCSAGSSPSTLGLRPAVHGNQHNGNVHGWQRRPSMDTSHPPSGNRSYMLVPVAKNRTKPRSPALFPSAS